ncbi:hypothetical protein ONK29_27655, partial [Salmonella enterica subsp. enterica serovar Anatum]|nr:hypothetical protein [Salmonella enterica subsp. enterica serovar Anatum]
LSLAATLPAPGEASSINLPGISVTVGEMLETLCQAGGQAARDPAAIKNRLAMMTPQNARIWYISPQEPHNKIAYFVDAPYQVD